MRTFLLLSALTALLLGANPAAADGVYDQHRVGGVRRGHEEPFVGSPAVTLLPGVTGLGLFEAESLLLDHGFVPVSRFVRSRHLRAWTVARQDPAGEVFLAPGSTVRLEVALPAAPVRNARVPSLHGLASHEAVRVLAEIGLAAELRHAPALFAARTVFRQEPAHGEIVRSGSVVRLTVALPGAGHAPASLRLPEVHGLRVEEVRRLGRETGFQVEVREVLAPDHAVDRVVVQEPLAGARVPLGALVRVMVPVVTQVPDLTGLAFAEARLAAARAGVELVADGPVRQGQHALVLHQSLPAGEAVARGSTIAVVLRVPLAVVPHLAGLSLEAARARLAQAGLEARFVGPALRAGTATEVVSQAFSPGTRLPHGSTVAVHYPSAGSLPPGRSGCRGSARPASAWGSTSSGSDARGRRRGLRGRSPRRIGLCGLGPPSRTVRRSSGGRHRRDGRHPMVDNSASNAGQFATVIGKDAAFKGELTFEGGVRVDGRFEGAISTAGQVLVSKDGQLKAEVSAGSVALEGRLEGNLTAKDRVELRATAQMMGDVRAAKLLVVVGATFVGRCEVGPGARAGAAAAAGASSDPKADPRAQVAAAAGGRK
jgi:cytoskeletal protein CcmA (bactofilin family)/beta-lactam-binding protein with PASTA domain